MIKTQYSKRLKRRKETQQGESYTNVHLNLEDKTWKILTYAGYTSKKVSKYIKKDNVNVTIINKNNLAKHLLNNKTKVTTKEKSGMYKINCSDCDAIYIGKSQRAIKTRIQEHIRSVSNNKKHTRLAKHCIDSGHTIKEEDVQILHRK